MPQHDMVIDNATGLAVRQDINAAIQALVQNNSGPVEPATMYPGQFWLDTTVAPNGFLRMRNQSNTGWINATLGGNIVRTVLTSSGTYTKPAGLRFVEVTLVGGGAGSTGALSTAAGQASAGGGGGGAGTVNKLYAATDLATTEAYAIGAGGGSPGGSGASGGNSTFKALVAGGGGGPATAYNTGGSAAGNTPAVATGGTGGTATGGDLNIPGGFGHAGWRCMNSVANQASPGPGGTSFLAQANFYIGHMVATTTGAGTGGRFPGGGAGGAANGQSQASVGGNAGGGGCIIFKEYF